MEFVLNRSKCIVAFEDGKSLPFFSKFSKPFLDMDIRVIGEGKQRVIVDIETADWLKTLETSISWVRDGKGISGVCIGMDENEDMESLEKALGRVDLAKKEPEVSESLETSMENLSVEDST